MTDELDPLAGVEADSLAVSMETVIQEQVDVCINEMVKAYRTSGITMDELTKVLIGNVAIIHGNLRLRSSLHREAIMEIDRIERLMQ